MIIVDLLRNPYFAGPGAGWLFAQVLKDTGAVDQLVSGAISVIGGSRLIAAALPSVGQDSTIGLMRTSMRPPPMP